MILTSIRVLNNGVSAVLVTLEDFGTDCMVGVTIFDTVIINTRAY